MFSVNRNPSTQDIEKFGRAMLLGFTAIGVLLIIAAAWGMASDSDAAATRRLRWIAAYMASLGVLFWATAVWMPRAGRWVYVAWMSVTLPIGVAMSVVMLTVLYVLLLPPFALIIRITDPLRRRLTRHGSYWEPYKPHEPTLERMRRPF